MGAVERIQAAIDTLESLKTDSFPGPWAHWPEADDIEIMNESFSHVIVSKVRPRDGWGGQIYRDNYEPNAELIVTLHRTIDAQIAVLRSGLEWLHEFVLPAPTYADGRPMSATRIFKVTSQGRATLALADAILGDA